MPRPETDHRPESPRYHALLAAYARARARYEADPTSDTLAVLETGLALMTLALRRPGKFELGQTVMTIGAQEAMRAARQAPPEFLLRHKHGDWGELPEDDIRENAWSLAHGARLFSAYRTRRDDKLWVITEWDRSVTTVLLPEEY